MEWEEGEPAGSSKAQKHKKHSRMAYSAFNGNEMKFEIVLKWLWKLFPERCSEPEILPYHHRLLPATSF